MLYTGKGDNGTTKLFDCPQGTRLSKSAVVFQALGTLDELNCSLGYAKALSEKSRDHLSIKGVETSYVEILERLQEMLFIVQAELGGADKHLSESHVDFAELVIAEVETLLPPITSFIIPGGGETGAYLDVCRTVARRAERGVIEATEKDGRKVSAHSLKFLNRMSSILYALARFANYQEGIPERGPRYETT